jgi:transposase-like protein
MPYKSEKIPLTEEQDRRRKLTAEQKTEIVQLYATGFHSLRSLGRQFGVDKSCIAIIVNPDRAKAVSQRIKEHWQDYVPTREEHAEIMREHRHYKQGLYLKGELNYGNSHEEN